jgi:hypothetical protein
MGENSQLQKYFDWIGREDYKDWTEEDYARFGYDERDVYMRIAPYVNSNNLDA